MSNVLRTTAVGEQTVPFIDCIIKNQSILISGLAKSVALGLRFAVIATEHPLIERLKGEFHATSWQLSPLLAEVACRWIDDGTAARDCSGNRPKSNDATGC